MRGVLLGVVGPTGRVRTGLGDRWSEGAWSRRAWPDIAAGGSGPGRATGSGRRRARAGGCSSRHLVPTGPRRGVGAVDVPVADQARLVAARVVRRERAGVAPVPVELRAALDGG